MEWHPGIAVEGGYDSNVFLRSGEANEPKVAVYKLRVTPHIQFNTRKLVGDGGRAEATPYSLTGNVSLSYNEFFKADSSAKEDVSGHRNLGVLAGLNLAIAPQGKVGGNLFAAVARSIQPSQYGDPTASINRTSPSGGAAIVWRPGGGLFSWAARYSAAFTFFESDRFKELNNVIHEIGTTGTWQFRPRTAINFDSTYGLIRYLNQPTIQPDGDFLRARIGLNGLATNTFGFTALAGYATTFFDTKGGAPKQDFDSFVGQLEGRFYLTPAPAGNTTPGMHASTLSFGVSRDFAQSYIGNFFTRDRAYASLSYFFGGRVLGTIGGGVARTQFPATFFDDGTARAAAFDAYIADANALVEYRFTPNFGVNLAGNYSAFLGDKRIPIAPNANPNDATQFDNLSWNRVEVLLGARYLMLRRGFARAEPPVHPVSALIRLRQLSRSMPRSSPLRWIPVLVVALQLVSCASGPRRRGELPPPVPSSTLGPGDRFEMVVVGEEKLPKEFTVAPDGSVDFPWISRQTVTGMEPQALAAFVRTELKERRYLSDATVIVSVKEFASKRITIGGQVVRPGEIPYTAALSLYRAIVSAGGFSPLADKTNVLVTRKLHAGGTKTVSFSVEDISEGRAPDVPLQAGDNIFVYDRNFLGRPFVPAPSKRIVVLHTGGTLLMQEQQGVLAPVELEGGLERELPVLGRIARIETRTIASLDSADMQPSDWQHIARAAHQALSEPDVDGVVVVHGTDTMAYSASAVALMLGPVPKPVVFTGAQRPLVEARTDARANLVDACLLATLHVPEVGIAFANQLLRGVRATKRDAWHLSAFASPNLAPLVELGLEVAISAHIRPAGGLTLDDRLDPRVVAFRLFPGFDARILDACVALGTRGFVLEAYGTGNLPCREGSLLPAIERAVSRGVTVLVVSQCFRGVAELSRYRGGLLAREAGALAGGDMTAEAALAKLMIGLGRFDQPDELRRFLERDVVGERSV
jgi:L-asparaginase